MKLLQFDIKCDDPVRLALAMKLTAKVHRDIKKNTCENPCQCRENIITTINALSAFGKDVFGLRPEFHIAIALMAAAAQEMHQEWDKTKTGEVIYL